MTRPFERPDDAHAPATPGLEGRHRRARRAGGTAPDEVVPAEHDPGEHDPGEHDPGEHDPGEHDPGENDPGENDPGENDPRETGGVGAGSAAVPLFSVPQSLRCVDVGVGGRAVRGLLLVAVVLLLTLGGRWWWVQQQAAGVPVEQVGAGAGTVSEVTGVDDATGDAPNGAVPIGAAPTGTLHGGTLPAGELPAPPGGQGAADVEILMVHVIGRVHDPGVVELPARSRVIDAVRAAGGVTDEADPASLNLARPVMDGEQVWVGAPGEDPPPGLGVGFVPSAHGGGAGAAGAGGGAPGADGGGGGVLVDLNLADQARLEDLPGIGPVTAGNILAWREQNGRFSVVEELMEVSGIGEKTMEQLRPHVTVGG